MYTVKKKSGSLAPNKTTAKSVNHDVRLHKYSTTFKNVLQVVIAILTVSLLLLLTVTVIKGICDAPEYVPIEHHVRCGETLWSIAKQYKPDDITMQEYMAWVYEQNGHDGNIYPGDVVIMAEVVIR